MYSGGFIKGFAEPGLNRLLPSNIKVAFKKESNLTVGSPTILLSNILKETGIDQILFNLNNILEEKDVRNYITNKMLNPAYVPQSQEERFIELSCAIEGVKYSWDQQKKMNTQVQNIGFLERRRKKLYSGELNVFEEALRYNTDKGIVFQNSDINLLIGAGGVISSAQNDEDIVFILNEGFLPSMTQYF